MQHTATTTATYIGPVSGQLVLQNLGPGIVYFDLESANESLTAGNGLKLASGSSFEYPRSSGGRVALVATEDSDVRYSIVS